MFQIRKALPAAAALALLSTTPAAAHHSGSMFDPAKARAIKGVVKTFEWVNPHSRIMIVGDSGTPEAAQSWMIETTSPGRLTREGGWSKNSLKPGDHVEVMMAPARTGARIGNMITVKNLDTGKVLGRAN